MFNITPLTAKDKAILTEKNIWKPACPVPLARLHKCQLSYVDFDGVKHDDGIMVVLDTVSEQVIAIFRELLAQKFPIHSIMPIDVFNGDDEASMAANNSSSFNFREIAGTSKLSMHSYGLAIDVNPLQNPYITGGVTYPDAGKAYLDRGNIRPGMVEPIVPIFAKHGFDVWGGDWETPKDWHHFQVASSKVHAG